MNVAAFSNPDSETIKAFLQSIKTIAVVGLSPKANRPSYKVAAALQGFGYRIIPVRPAVDAVLGEKAYPDLAAIGQPVDLVDVFRAPEYVDEIVDACIELAIPAIWLQDGVVNQAAAVRARKAGMFVVMDRCIYRDYLSLIGPSDAD